MSNEPIRPASQPLAPGANGLALGGITAALALHAFVAGIVFDIAWLVKTKRDWPDAMDILGGLFIGVSVPVIACCVLVVPVLLVASGALSVSLRVAGTLPTSLRNSSAYAAAVAGGTTGFAITVPWVIGMHAQLDEYLYYIALALGPGLATLFGQIGGCYWLLNSEPPKAAANARATRPAIVYGVRHLLVATAWLASVLGLLRLLAGSSPTLVGSVLVWTFYQAGTLMLAVPLVRWRWERGR